MTAREIRAIEPHTQSPETTFAILAGGGTGGHLLPGLAVARALVARGHDPATIHFVGSDTGVERRLVPAAGFTVDELPGRGIQRRLTLANVAKMHRAFTGERLNNSRKQSSHVAESAATSALRSPPRSLATIAKVV